MRFVTLKVKKMFDILLPDKTETHGLKKEKRGTQKTKHERLTNLLRVVRIIGSKEAGEKLKEAALLQVHFKSVCGRLFAHMCKYTSM